MASEDDFELGVIFQTAHLIGCELEHEIVREPILISLYRFVERFCCNVIKPREIGIHHHLFTADQIDPMLDLDR